MTSIDEIMDKVDTDLIKLIDANHQFSEYRKFAPTTGTAQTVVITGSIGIEIKTTRSLELTISTRG